MNADLIRANARIGELETVLRGCWCPRPANRRPGHFTVGECVDAGEYGCSDGAPLRIVGKEEQAA